MRPEFFKAIKWICQPTCAFLHTEMTDLPTLSYTSTSEIPTTHHIPEDWKRYPSWKYPMGKNTSSERDYTVRLDDGTFLKSR